MSPDELSEFLRPLVAGLIPVLFAITLHEVAHGWAARALGDRTAEMLGRLSLNPLRHVDPVGTVVVPLALYTLSGGSFLFGWAKPVPVAARNLNNPKRDMVKVAAAGPAANIAMGLFWAALMAVVFRGWNFFGPAASFLLEMGKFGLFFNCLLAVFNLIPIPPLDGGRVLRGLVPEGIGRHLDTLEPFGLILVLLLLVSKVIWPIIVPVLVALQSLLLTLVGLGG